MSHTTQINSVPIKNISALYKAVDALNKQGIKCSLVENVKPRMYHANQVDTCPYVLKLPACKYDVGFQYNEEEKSYTPVFDDWKGYIKSILGTKGTEQDNSMGKLLQEYTKQTVLEEALRQGYNVSTCEINEDGEIIMDLLVEEAEDLY